MLTIKDPWDGTIYQMKIEEFLKVGTERLFSNGTYRNKKCENNLAEITLKISDTKKKKTFTYSDKEIFAVNLPEELRKILRLLPASMPHLLVEKIENFLVSDRNEFPLELEIEKEILQLV